MKELVIQILNYNTSNDSILLVKHLLKSLHNINYIIVLIDNCSTNDSYFQIKKEFDQEPLVDILLSKKNEGFARGNNYGLNYSEKYNPKYVLVINNDVIFDVEIIKKMIELYTKLDKTAILSPLQKLPNNSFEKFRTLKIPTFINDVLSNLIIYNFFIRKTHKFKRNIKRFNVQKVDIIPGCFIFIDYQLFKSLGFFYDKTFLFCEERFLSQKIKNRKLNNYFILDLFYIHNHSKTIKKEVTVKNQHKFLNEGKCLFTSRYRKYPRIKIAILKFSFFIWKLEYSLFKK